MANCWLHAFRAVRLSRTEARVIFARLSSDTLLCEYEELLRDTQLYSGHIFELGEVREHLSKTGLSRAPDAEVLIAAAADASGAARIDLDGGVYGRHLGSQISARGDAKLVHGGPEPIGWSEQAVIVELGEINVDLRGHCG